MKVTDNLQSEVKDGMLELASGKSVPVMMNCAALSDPEKTKSLRLPILRVKALCIPDAICDVIVGNVDEARSPEDPDISVMVGAATTRAQAKRGTVTKPLRLPDMERHGGVECEQSIKLQQEDPRIQELWMLAELRGEEGKLFPSRKRGASCIVETRILDIV
ncbi:hypothetical protein ElyMa_005775400 [Elysia marginata]|uniref:Uncharacterized protein n=1 Tax=Elysia marginata TaxID=1093978 RepID=A0AAV4FRI2_9GAST|nr:hypothetical protein ElyMa_005775400 [Elysia marginata]